MSEKRVNENESISMEKIKFSTIKFRKTYDKYFNIKLFSSRYTRFKRLKILNINHESNEKAKANKANFHQSCN